MALVVFQKKTSEHVDVLLEGEKFQKTFSFFKIKSLSLPNKFYTKKSRKTMVYLSISTEGIPNSWFGILVPVKLAKTWANKEEKFEIKERTDRRNVVPHMCVHILDENKKEIKGYNGEWSLEIELFE